ncbi:MAG: alpha/beta hydrolase [Bacteroidetes bacterium]|nr:MAG: alpha/beta hydrolase [Bacteroidota bacterium]
MKYQLTTSEKIKKFLALTILKLPLPIIKLLNGKPIQIDGQTMDPLVQFMVKYFVDHEVGYIPSTDEERREFDIQGNWFAHNPESSVSITKWTVNGPNGEILCEIHRPAKLPPENASVLMFYHGGGYVSGSLESHKNLCRQLAHEVNCAVVVVDYRLAPEYKFPIGINDCLAVFDAAIAQALELGFDPKRISVGGDSAGGNAAAVIAQQRKGSSFPPKFQALWVPWLDMSKQTRSYELMGEGFFLEKKKMEWYTKHYLRSEEDAMNPLASPLLGDVKGVCDAAVFGAGFDPLRDEGRAYVEKLKSAGVPTQYTLFEGVVHPFINVAGKIPIARKAFDEAVIILKANM